MTRRLTESRFEEWIEQSLLNKGYHSSFVHNSENDNLYNRDLCLLSQEVIDFIKSTQEEEYNKLFNQFEGSTDTQILKKLEETITKRGIIDTLRNGFSTRGSTFNLLYFKPKSTLNTEHSDLYYRNKFTVVRQLHFSKRNNKSLDMVLFINGIPVVTMELKNQMSGQSILESEKQYQRDRDPKEPLFHFKRCLVHFCVDNDKVSMTTKLNGEGTRFLPYNKDITNPVVEDNYRTEYLWNEVLTPDSLLDIIENFVLIDKVTSKEWSDRTNRVEEKVSEQLIFPRYHQLDVIRKIRNKVREEGVGNNYLIQHTTGAGKSYSIGYLSHTLTSLYRNEGDTKRMFDSILVITDRKVLDKQLQVTISKLEQTGGVVNSVDINSQQLREYLEKGKDIIITTIQKFPVISKTISELKGKTFGVIIDEVHSSQSGETSKHLKTTLSKSDEQDDEEEVDYEDLIREEISRRGKQPHISFFGFTGTPKSKTLELFGRKNQEGQFVPFHTYTMRQSIYEKFTLDVLQNYTTYKRYFKVLKKGEEDREVSEGKGMRLLVQWVDSHEVTITQKVSIILDHFVNVTSKKIEGRGRGMVVLRSRLHCVLFQKEMVKQMRERGLPYSCLVGFSGKVKIIGDPVEYTEGSLNSENGMTGGNIPDGFKDPKFRILIVSNKFVTGFDEPLLHSMYVDKKLNGVQCVQTLSRLNRSTKGKTDTFVLDFVNETDEIVESFQPYYTTTLLTEETDPDKLYDMVYEIERYNLYTKYQVDQFCKEFFTKSDFDEKLQPILGQVVEIFKERLTDEEKDKFKSLIQSFIRLYSYVSQISNFGEVEWEKTYVFLRSLNKLLPKGPQETVSIADLVDLDSLRIQMVGESRLTLENQQGELNSNFGTGGQRIEDERTLISQIIEKLNNTFGVELGEDDRVNLERVQSRVSSNEELQQVMNGNNTEDAKLDFFRELFRSEMVEYHGERMDFYRKVMDGRIFPQLVESMFQTLLRSGNNR